MKVIFMIIIYVSLLTLYAFLLSRHVALNIFTSLYIFRWQYAKSLLHAINQNIY